MSLTISLAKCNVAGFIACAEYDEEMESITLALGNNPKRTCAAAAKKLRNLADRFDALARDPEPCKVTTHKRINRRTRTAMRPNAGLTRPASDDAKPGPGVTGSGLGPCSIPAGDA